MGDLVLPNPAYSFAAHASMLTHCMVECQAESNFFRHLEIMPVIPSLRSRASSERSEGSLRQARQILRCAQDDSQDISQVRSQEALSPNVYNFLQLSIRYIVNGNRKIYSHCFVW